MSNENYDQLSDLPGKGLNWATSSVVALLYDGAEFDSTQERVSEVGTWLKREPLQGRFITDDGDWAGLPALFYMVEPDKEYQLILGYDDGRQDELLISFFDQTAAGTPLTVERRGSMFVRPAFEEDGQPPTYSIWLRPEQA